MSSQSPSPASNPPFAPAAAQETPHPFPGVGIDPRFRLPFTPEHAAAAEKMREEREKTGDFSLPTSSSSVQSPSAPPQPMPCIGIGPNARLPYTEEHAEEARKIRAERAAIGGTETDGKQSGTNAQ